MTTAALKPEIGRRDFLNISAGAVAGLGITAAVWPLIDQMNPSAAALSAGSPMTVELRPLSLGQQIIVRWRSMPIFIVRRTPQILSDLKAPDAINRLRDPASQSRQQPAYAQNWSRSISPDFLVVVGICTHLGCIPSFSPKAGSLVENAPGGYLCHCHGSKYDLAGRVFKNVPAPLNLPVPPHHFPDANTLVIGENPKGMSFDLAEVEQL